MATLEELVIRLTADTQDLRAELKTANSATASAMKTMEKAVKDFSEKGANNMTFFQQTMATMAGFVGGTLIIKAFETASEAVAFLGHELVGGVEAAAAQEKALVRLANALALSGQYSEEAMHGLQDFVESMERLTGVEDTVIASNLALLSSLTKLDAEGLKMAERAALDFAAATGKDVDSAVTMVAKAINGQTDSFGKMGIKIAETTDKSLNLKNVMAALSNTTGSAEGIMKTFSGSLLSVQIAYDNMFKALGKAVVQNPVVLEGMKAITQVFGSIENAAKDSGSELQQGIGYSLLFISEAFILTAQSADAFFRVFNGGMDIAIQGVNIFGALKGKIAEAFGGEATEGLNAWRAASKDLQKQWSGDTSLGEMTKRLQDFSDKGASAFLKIGEASTVITPTVKGVQTAVEELGNALQIVQDEKLKAFAEGFAQQNLLVSEQYAAELEQLKASFEAKLISEEEYIKARNETRAAQEEAELAQLDAFYAGKLGKDEEYKRAKDQLLDKQILRNKVDLKDEAARQDKNDTLLYNMKMQTLANLATLATSSSKTLAGIGKAAAITQATIDGYVAVQKTLAGPPGPPWTVALAASIGVMTAANVAKIAGVALAGGIDEVPGVGSADNYPAMLAPGERVVPSKTNKDLKQFLDQQQAGEGGSGRMTVEIFLKEGLVEFIEAKILERQSLGTSLLGAT